MAASLDYQNSSIYCQTIVYNVWVVYTPNRKSSSLDIQQITLTVKVRPHKQKFGRTTSYNKVAWHATCHICDSVDRGVSQRCRVPCGCNLHVFSSYLTWHAQTRTLKTWEQVTVAPNFLKKLWMYGHWLYDNFLQDHDMFYIVQPFYVKSYDQISIRVKTPLGNINCQTDGKGIQTHCRQSKTTF